MGIFDFDCLVCGGDQDDIKSRGYFTNFKTEKVCVKGECRWCEGCVYRNIPIQYFLHFEKVVKEVELFINSLSFEKIDEIEKLLMGCKNTYFFIPHIVYAMFVESDNLNSFYETVSSYYSKLYQMLSFSKFKENITNCTDEKDENKKELLSETEREELDLKKVEWNKNRCLSLLLIIYDCFPSPFLFLKSSEEEEVEVRMVVGNVVPCVEEKEIEEKEDKKYQFIIKTLSSIVNNYSEPNLVLKEEDELPKFQRKQFELSDEFEEPRFCLFKDDEEDEDDEDSIFYCFKPEHTKGSRLCKIHMKHKTTKTKKYKEYIEKTHKSQTEKVIKEMKKNFELEENDREELFKEELKIMKDKLNYENNSNTQFDINYKVKWTQQQITYILSNRFLNRSIDDEMCIKSDCDYCNDSFNTFLNLCKDKCRPISTYTNYFKFWYTEDNNSIENCCIYQKYLNSNEDSSNIKWHSFYYEAYGIIDECDDGEVSVFKDCGTLIYTEYGCCTAHINNSKLNHYEINFLNSFRNPKIKEEIEEKEKTNFLNHFTEYCNQFYPIVSKFDLSLSLINNQTNTETINIPSLYLKVLINNNDYNTILALIKDSNKRINIVDVDTHFNEWLSTSINFKNKDNCNFIQSLTNSSIPLLYYLEIETNSE